jgi:hypothetical protein
VNWVQKTARSRKRSSRGAPEGFYSNSTRGKIISAQKVFRFLYFCWILLLKLSVQDGIAVREESGSFALGL